MVRFLDIIKKFFHQVYLKLFKGKVVNLTITILIFILGVTVVFLAFKYWDNIIIAIPGVVSHDEYSDLTSQKNELIDENSLLLTENSEYETALASLEVEDFEQKSTLYNSVILNLQVVIENLEEMVSYGDDFAKMQLPVYVSRYTELTKELDELRLDAAKLSLSITNARKDINELNWKRELFDTCLNEVGWDGDDADINTEISACVLMIDGISEYVLSLETKYDIELVDMKNYFVILKEQWTASADYYSALSKGSYSSANDYDTIFAEKRRDIDEMDLEIVFGSFNIQVITPLVDDFAEVSENISAKQNEVDTWYEENIEK